jgi:hypothetical protein
MPVLQPFSSLENDFFAFMQKKPKSSLQFCKTLFYVLRQNPVNLYSAPLYVSQYAVTVEPGVPWRSSHPERFLQYCKSVFLTAAAQPSSP